MTAFVFFFYIGISLCTTVSETFMAFRPEHPKRDQTLQLLTLSKTTSYQPPPRIGDASMHRICAKTRS